MPSTSTFAIIVWTAVIALFVTIPIIFVSISQKNKLDTQLRRIVMDDQILPPPANCYLNVTLKFEYATTLFKQNLIKELTLSEICSLYLHNDKIAKNYLFSEVFENLEQEFTIKKLLEIFIRGMVDLELQTNAIASKCQIHASSTGTLNRIFDIMATFIWGRDNNQKIQQILSLVGDIGMISETFGEFHWYHLCALVKSENLQFRTGKHLLRLFGNPLLNDQLQLKQHLIQNWQKNKVVKVSEAMSQYVDTHHNIMQKLAESNEELQQHIEYKENEEDQSWRKYFPDFKLEIPLLTQEISLLRSGQYRNTVGALSSFTTTLPKLFALYAKKYKTIPVHSASTYANWLFELVTRSLLLSFSLKLQHDDEPVIFDFQAEVHHFTKEQLRSLMFHIAMKTLHFEYATVQIQPHNWLEMCKFVAKNDKINTIQTVKNLQSEFGYKNLPRDSQIVLNHWWEYLQLHIPDTPMGQFMKWYFDTYRP